MDPENKKSDAEEILSEFQKTHGDEPVEEPQRLNLLKNHRQRLNLLKNHRQRLNHR